MEDILDVIKARRTIKHFLPKFVSWEMVSKVLDAGRHAPSCGNIQNWKFLLVMEPELKQLVAQAANDQYEIAEAGVLIIVTGEPDRAERYYGLRGERLYTIQNCAAAIQNMLLEATSLGLGTTWVGAFDEDAIRTTFKIPENVRPQAIIALGYAKEIPPKPPKYPLEVVTYFNKWRSKMRDPAKYMADTAVILARRGAEIKDVMQKGAKFVVDKVKEVAEKKVE
jgi:nitroreductase